MLLKIQLSFAFGHRGAWRVATHPLAARQSGMRHDRQGENGKQRTTPRSQQTKEARQHQKPTPKPARKPKGPAKPQGGDAGKEAMATASPLRKAGHSPPEILVHMMQKETWS